MEKGRIILLDLHFVETPVSRKDWRRGGKVYEDGIFRNSFVLGLGGWFCREVGSLERYLQIGLDVFFVNLYEWWRRGTWKWWIHGKRLTTWMPCGVTYPVSTFYNIIVKVECWDDCCQLWINMYIRESLMKIIRWQKYRKDS